MTEATPPPLSALSEAAIRQYHQYCTGLYRCDMCMVLAALDAAREAQRTAEQDANEWGAASVAYKQERDRARTEALRAIRELGEAEPGVPALAERPMYSRLFHFNNPKGYPVAWWWIKESENPVWRWPLAERVREEGEG